MLSPVFTSELQKMLEGNSKEVSKPLVVGKPSFILSKCGANIENDITITKKVIDKALKPEIRDEDGRMVGRTGHGLTVDQLISGLTDLDEPMMVFKGKQKGSLLVITDVEDLKGRKIVVAIELNRKEGFTSVNSIRSVYGRDNLDFYIGENIKNGNLLAAKKEVADELLRSIGKSYPKENTFISYGYHFTVFSEKSQGIRHMKRNMTIGDRIFERLQQINMSQKVFSENTGISQSTISEWKSKRTNPTSEKIMIICKVLEVTPEWLLSGIDSSGERGNSLPWFVVDRNSELGLIIEGYHRMDGTQRARLLGYLEAISERTQR